MSIPRYITPKHLRRIFYVYGLFDECGIIRYIGKGHAKRWLSHDKGNDKNNWRKNRFIKQTLRALGDIPKIKIRQELTEAEAFIIEVVLIKAIGRYPNGPLYNLTDNRNGPSSERMKAWHASRTFEERSASAKKAQATMGPEARSNRARNNAAKISFEEWSTRFKKIADTIPPEKRRENGIKGGKASTAKLSPEQKRDRALHMTAIYMATTTPEQRHENYKKTGIAKMTSEQLRIIGTKGATTANNNRTAEERSTLGRKAAAALHASRTAEERVECARVAGLQAYKGLTFEIRSKGAFKRAATLTKEELSAIALKGVATRKLRGWKAGNSAHKESRWINNGTTMHKLKKVERLPTGWVYGMLKHPK